MYEIIMQYIQPELVIVAVVLYLLGLWLKNISLADKWIPLVLGVLGIALCTLYIVATQDLSGGYQHILIAVFDAIIQGILVAGLSNYVNQMIKQLGKEE